VSVIGACMDDGEISNIHNRPLVIVVIYSKQNNAINYAEQHLVMSATGSFHESRGLAIIKAPDTLGRRFRQTLWFQTQNSWMHVAQHRPTSSAVIRCD